MWPKFCHCIFLSIKEIHIKVLGNSFFQKYKRIEISHRKISTETISEISMQRCTFVQKEINLKYLISL